MLTKAELWLGPGFTSFQSTFALVGFRDFFFFKHMCEICSMLQIAGLHWSDLGHGGHPQEEDEGRGLSSRSLSTP